MGILGSLLGGVMGLGAQSMANKAQAQENEKNYERQKEFAQNSIQWKVQDAEAAGLHRLAGIGTTSTQYIPTGGGTDSSPQIAADMGQGIGDAIANSRVQRQSMQLDLESKKLENENKRLQNLQIMQEMGQNTLSNLSNTSSMGLGNSTGLSGQGTTAGSIAGKIPSESIYGVTPKPEDETTFAKSPAGFWHITPSEKYRDYYSENMFLNIAQGLRNAYNTEASFKNYMQKKLEKKLKDEGSFDPKKHRLEHKFTLGEGHTWRVVPK